MSTSCAFYTLLPALISASPACHSPPFLPLASARGGQPRIRGCHGEAGLRRRAEKTCARGRRRMGAGRKAVRAPLSCLGDAGPRGPDGGSLGRGLQTRARAAGSAPREICARALSTAAHAVTSPRSQRSPLQPSPKGCSYRPARGAGLRDSWLSESKSGRGRSPLFSAISAR